MQSPSPSLQPEGTPLLLAEAVPLELYLWLESGALDRLVLASRGQAPKSGRLYWEAIALRRCSTALVWYFGGNDQYVHVHERSLTFILDDLIPSESGVAMFSAHLQQQLSYWGGRVRTAGGFVDEAQSVLRIVDHVSRRFHAALGLAPEVVNRRARLLALDTQPCSGAFLTWKSDGSVEVEDPLGPKPRDE